jgi:hypothetical protein
MTRQHGTAEQAADRIQLLRTGEVASAVRVNVQTLRYYERRGQFARDVVPVLGMLTAVHPHER